MNPSVSRPRRYVVSGSSGVCSGTVRASSGPIWRYGQVSGAHLALCADCEAGVCQRNLAEVWLEVTSERPAGPTRLGSVPAVPYITPARVVRRDAAARAADPHRPTRPSPRDSVSKSPRPPPDAGERGEGARRPARHVYVIPPLMSHRAAQTGCNRGFT